MLIALAWEGKVIDVFRRVAKDEHEEMFGKYIAESEAIRKVALESGACIDEDMVVADDSSWTRINKPTQTEKPVCIVLYDLDKVNENQQIDDGAIVSERRR